MEGPVRYFGSTADSQMEWCPRRCTGLAAPKPDATNFPWATYTHTSWLAKGAARNRGAAHAAITHQRLCHWGFAAARTERQRLIHANPRSTTPRRTAPSRRRWPEPTPGPPLAGPAQAGSAGPSHPGAAPEAATGQTWAARGP